MLLAYEGDEAGVLRLLVPLLGVVYAATVVSVIRLRRQRLRVSLCVLDDKAFA
jgi:hypothetical protein